MDYMWCLVGYVCLAYLADWMVDRMWWWYVDRVLKGGSRRKELTTGAKGRDPVSPSAGAPKLLIRGRPSAPTSNSTLLNSAWSNADSNTML